MHTRTIGALALAVWLTPATGSASAAPWLCTATDAQFCRAGRCTPIAATVAVTLDNDSGTYRRCAGSDCAEPERARVSAGSGYTLAELPGRGAFLRVVADSGEFVEVVTLGATVYVNTGRCALLQ
ncbi:MAG TPA: hypothetical protein VD995_04725 [Azospirillum sp.]|nr:hypothetical protein [Azospirillum sp.]